MPGTIRPSPLGPTLRMETEEDAPIRIYGPPASSSRPRYGSRRSAFQERPDVILHGPLGYAQPGLDLLVLETLRQQLQDIPLPERDRLRLCPDRWFIADAVQTLRGNQRLLERPSGVQSTDGVEKLVTQCTLKNVPLFSGLDGRQDDPIVGVKGGGNDNWDA